ncbi:BppU family phage baseplate upper protein [Listeria monocytogenes]|nr:BppU family phage baseplate upper protein [Listeria monocytogenes]EKZ4177127.1 BppU family phage baseplate upper protein [Listeria monocytogenes]EKZ4214742.1 BppU family phage baseplate upper protein [Listeria monocytogenes]
MSNLRKINATLDLNRKSWSIERIEAIQGDINSLTIAAQIVLDGKGMNLTDYTPTFAVVLPGTNAYVIDDLHFDIRRLSEGYFEYTFVKEAFSVPGVYDTARFILQKKDKTELSGMPRFTYYVEKDPLQGKVIAESYISDFERLEGLIADVETEITGLHDEVTSESMRLDTEIAELDAKIDTETSKLQTEANNLQTQFDSFNPSQFAQQKDFENHIYNSDIHVTIANKIAWESKETPDGAQAKADKALADAKAFFELSSEVQSVNLTPKNGFIATQPLVARYVKFGTRFLVLIGGIVGKGTGTGIGVCASVPSLLAPDTAWNKLFSASQQSSSANNRANVYISSGGDISVVAAGDVTVNTGLDCVIYFTKEVTT